MFTTADARWLGESVRSMYQARTAAELVRSAMDDVDRRWTLNSSACEEFNRDASIYIPHDLRMRGAVVQDFAAYVHDNPVLTGLQSDRVPPVLRLSALVSRREWEKTDHYNGIARVTGYNDQLAIILQAESSIVAFSLYPDTVLGTSDQLLAGLLQSHLKAAWHRVQNRPATPAGLDSPRIALTEKCGPRHLTAGQRALLRAYFPRWHGHSATLPRKLQEWAREWLRRWSTAAPAPAMQSFKVQSARGQLLVRCFPAPPEAGVSAELLLTEVPISTLDPRPTAPLTSREREVLHWIAQGKRDAEIAILGSAPATVSKHVENILRKLGAETRTGCVATARMFLDSSRA